jgi:hypothetical protein
MGNEKMLIGESIIDFMTRKVQKIDLLKTDHKKWNRAQNGAKLILEQISSILMA